MQYNKYSKFKCIADTFTMDSCTQFILITNENEKLSTMHRLRAVVVLVFFTWIDWFVCNDERSKKKTRKTSYTNITTRWPPSPVRTHKRISMFSLSYVFNFHFMEEWAFFYSIHMFGLCARAHNVHTYMHELWTENFFSHLYEVIIIVSSITIFSFNW